MILPEKALSKIWTKVKEEKFVYDCLFAECDKLLLFTIFQLSPLIGRSRCRKRGQNKCLQAGEGSPSSETYTPGYPPAAL